MSYANPTCRGYKGRSALGALTYLYFCTFAVREVVNLFTRRLFRYWVFFRDSENMTTFPFSKSMSNGKMTPAGVQ